ncbi:Type 1 glutamine amidotransferase-like domain-containing protein [Cryomorphaceae bacterium]|nr:Type 1 glutamine amidotransferase-like domain-containing protein [Cryomorphaceae bacterium]
MKYLLLLCFISTLFNTSGQGSLLLVGGGSEDYNSWSDDPYGWAVQQADSGRVAIIAHGSATQWLPDYFESLGASQAVNFNISDSSSANAPHLLDTLKSYDMIFFKGGDQWDYLRTFRGTPVQWAVDSVFDNGGVIAGTSAGLAILSDWVYTAENGTVYPDEALSDVYHHKSTLDTGMWSFYSGYLFDSHFIERGRLGRLLSFIAQLNAEGSSVWGVGVDDRTALCVDVNGLGTVMGTGTVTFIDPVTDISGALTYGFQDSILYAKDVFYHALKDGEQWDLVQAAPVSSSASFINPPYAAYRETQVLVSGGLTPTENDPFLNLLASYWNANDVVQIMCSDLNDGAAYKNALNNKGFANATVLQITGGSSDQYLSSVKDLWVGVDHQDYQDYVQNNSSGALLDSMYAFFQAFYWFPKSYECAFVGPDIRWVGKTYVEGLETDPYNAYYGDLELKPGFNIIPNSVLIPWTYQSSSTALYENTISSGPWAMAEDTLTYALWFQAQAYAEYFSAHPVRDTIDNALFSILSTLNSQGHNSLPLFYMANPGAFAESLDQTHGSGYTRQNSSANRFYLGYDHWIEMAYTSAGAIAENRLRKVQVFPNPSADWIQVETDQVTEATLIDLSGKAIRQWMLHPNDLIPIQGLEAGRYQIRLKYRNGELAMGTFIKP